jgi:4'-phosphopantetheinyl transferase EntD
VRHRVIERLLPAGVACAEAFSDVPESTMDPIEAAVVARAVAKRRREFATVRHCARQALDQLGVPPAPLLPGARGAPQWPEGIVGSMTHCDGYRAALVARSWAVHALGVDAEPHEPLPKTVLRMIAGPEEIVMLATRTAADSTVCWGRLLFCAKEAVYKAWFPLAQRRLTFRDVSVALAADGTIAARLLIDGPVVAANKLTGFSGRWLVDRGLIVAVVSVPVKVR